MSPERGSAKSIPASHLAKQVVRISINCSKEVFFPVPILQVKEEEEKNQYGGKYKEYASGNPGMGTFIK